MLLIIFGAGASFDHDKFSTTKHGYPKLPLANDLINKNLYFVKEAMTKWTGAVPLLNRLNELKDLQKGLFDLEDALFSEFQRNNDAVKGQLLSFQFYVHDIIRSCEQEVRSYNQGNTNYTRLLDILQQKSIDQNKGICLVTFNYDTLLDTACSQIYPDWEFTDFDDYITGCTVVRLYKPHGSLSWKQSHDTRHQPSRVSTVKILQHPTQFGLTARVQQIQGYELPHSQFITGSNYVSSPILAIPYKQKTGFVFPENHRNALIHDMEKISHILTVGWRGAEKHFQQEILGKIPESNQVKILNVNMGSKHIENNLKEFLDKKILKIDTYSLGFTKFLEDRSVLEKFLTA